MISKGIFFRTKEENGKWWEERGGGDWKRDARRHEESYLKG